MSGRTVLITGGSQGVGLATARALAERDYRIALVSRDPAHLEEAVSSLPERCEERVAAFSADVRDEGSIAAAVTAAVEHFGGLDAVLTCAGVSMSARDRLIDTDATEWRRIMSTNLDGTYYTLHAALPYLEHSADAHIITMLSTGAWAVGPGTSLYAASKFGARALTEGLMAEYRGSGIRITSVSPGPIDTTIWTHKRVGPTPDQRKAMLRPSDVADIFVWLLERPAGMHIRDITVTPWRTEA
jgi:NADP-dependent 3-hydroxy acid dehydrogenase YdfG